MKNETPLQYLGSFVALDFETTGTDVTNDAIIEIGALKYENGHEVDRFHTLVNPFMPLPPYITELTGITEEDLQAAPAFAHIIEPFWQFIDGYPLMAHNARFELKFLQKFFGRDFQPPLLDTVQLFQLLFPEQHSHSLEQVARHLGLSLPGGQSHRALEDATLMVEAVQRAIHLLMLPEHHHLIATIVALLERLDGTRWQWRTLFQNLHQVLGLPAASLDQNPLYHPGLPEEENRQREKGALDPLFFYLPVAVQDVLAEWIESVVATPVHFVETSKRARRVGDWLAQQNGESLLIASEPSWEWLLSTLLGALSYVQETGKAVCIVAPGAQKREDLVEIAHSLKQYLQAEELQIDRVWQPVHFVCPRRLPALLEGYYPEGDDPVASEFFVRLFLTLWGMRTTTGRVQELPPQLRSHVKISQWLEKLTHHTEECLQQSSQCFYGRYYQTARNAHLLFADYGALLNAQQPELQLLPLLRPAIIGLEAEVLEDLLIAQNTIRIPLHQVLSLLHHLEDRLTEQEAFRSARYAVEELLAELRQSQRQQIVTYVPLSGHEQSSEWLAKLHGVGQQLQLVVEQLNRLPADFQQERERITTVLQEWSQLLDQFSRANYVSYGQLHRDGNTFLVSSQLQLTDSVEQLLSIWQNASTVLLSSSLFYHPEERHRLSELFFGTTAVPFVDLPLESARRGKVIFTKGLPRSSSEYFGEKIALMLHRLLPLLPANAWIVAHQRNVLSRIYQLVQEILGDRLIYYGKTHRTLTALREELAQREDAVLLSRPLDFHALGYRFGPFRWIIYDRLPYIIPTPRTQALRQQWLDAVEESGEMPALNDWEAIEQPMMFRNFRKLFDFVSYGVQDAYTVAVLDPNLSSTTLASYHRRMLEYVPHIKPVLEHYEQIIAAATGPVAGVAPS